MDCTFKLVVVAPIACKGFVLGPCFEMVLGVLYSLAITLLRKGELDALL